MCSLVAEARAGKLFLGHHTLVIASTSAYIISTHAFENPAYRMLLLTRLPYWALVRWWTPVSESASSPLKKVSEEDKLITSSRTLKQKNISHLPMENRCVVMYASLFILLYNMLLHYPCDSTKTLFFEFESSLNISLFCVNVLLPLGCSTLTQQMTVEDNKLNL